MPKTEIKTRINEASVEDFIASVADEAQRRDAEKIDEMMRRLSGAEPKMWGESIIGYGILSVKSPATGREVDWMKIGFSPRKGNLSLYVLNGSAKQDDLLTKLGKHKAGKGCLYIKKLADIDEKILEKIIESAYKKK